MSELRFRAADRRGITTINPDETAAFCCERCGGGNLSAANYGLCCRDCKLHSPRVGKRVFPNKKALVEWLDKGSRPAVEIVTVH